MTTTLAAPRPHPATDPRPAQGRGGLDDRECVGIPMPVPDRTSDPTDPDVLHERAEHGLRHYIAQTAHAVGTGPEAAWSEWADAPSAYIALDHRLPDHPDRDTALVWAAERGWAIAVESGCGEDLLITATQGGDALPSPDAVARWVRAVHAGRHTDTSCHHAAVGTDLVNRLADWAEHEPTVGKPHNHPRTRWE